MTDEPATDHIAGGSRRPVYVERINAVVDYIEQHLAEDLTVERLAAGAHFSPFHLYRVFGALVGEPAGSLCRSCDRAGKICARMPCSFRD